MQYNKKISDSPFTNYVSKYTKIIPTKTYKNTFTKLKELIKKKSTQRRLIHAYIPELDGCIATGLTVGELKESLQEAVEFHLAGMKEDGLEIPEAFKKEYAFNYKMDIESFFEWFQGVLTKAGISKLTGMNQSLVSQYANGLKKPSKKQTTRIQTALHEFGEELLQIHF